MDLLFSPIRARDSESITALEQAKGAVLHTGLKKVKRDSTIIIPASKRKKTSCNTVQVKWDENSGRFNEVAATLRSAMGSSSSSAAPLARDAAALSATVHSPVRMNIDIGLERQPETVVKFPLSWASSVTSETDDAPPVFTFGSFEPVPATNFSSLTSVAIPGASSCLSATSSSKAEAKPATQTSSSCASEPSVIDRLNVLEQRDRSKRRADKPIVAEQDPGEFRNQLLSMSQHGATLSIAHSDGISELSHSSLGVTSSSSLALSAMEAPCSITSSGPASLKDQPILIYGFDKQRGEMKQNLEKHFDLQNLQTMNQYNAGLRIGLNFGFKGYCHFFQNVKNKSSFRNTAAVPDHSTLTVNNIKKWADCLCKNVEYFDCSGKLNTSNERIRFLIKNCDAKAIRKISNIKVKPEESLKNFLNEGNWDEILGSHEDVFNLLNSVQGKSMTKLLQEYDALSLNSKILLDQMVSYAFLRKTSKLGLTFARENNMPVLFAWNIPGVPNNLEEMRNILETKRYKFDPAEARLVSGDEKTLEAITLSEMREVGRLMQKGLAPSYLLLVQDEKAKKAAPSSLVPSSSPFSRMSISSAGGAGGGRVAVKNDSSSS